MVQWGIRRGRVPTVLHVLLGEDDYSIRQALEEIKTSIGDHTALMTNSTVFDGRQVTAAELKMACETVPFLAEKRLVVVEGLLEKYETGGRTGRRKAAKKNGEAPEEWKAIAEGIRSLPEFTELVIIGGKISERNPFLKELAGTGRVKQFPKLTPRELTRWVTQRIAGDGGSIAPRAADTLVRFVGSDLWMMANETEKLVQYAGGRTIEEEDVRRVVSATQEANIFGMVDAIMEGRTARAQDLYQQLLTDGVVPVQLLAMISRQVRILFQMKDMRARKKTRNEIRTALGLTNDFVLNKAGSQADKYSTARLRDIYHRLLDADIAIKTGWYDGELALSIFIAETGPGGPVSA